MINPVVEYKRAEGSPWMAVPRMSVACFQRFKALGTWAAMRRLDGSIEWRV